ncbi:12221_t:CDS:2 [Gigaspora margarita]|uniref:12221_t:CDS:1 n=1 Tax=Gigaspora margarita TaxID=4874 RepID=A0ABN7UP90_GIGMA|nr:12221_t:CDS:2 [Gigaspora margarita]
MLYKLAEFGKQWSADFTQVYEDQTNNSLPTEWSMELSQDQTIINLPNVYNPFIEWSTGITQNDVDQTNHNLSIEQTTCLEDKHPVSFVSRRKKGKNARDARNVIVKELFVIKLPSYVKIVMRPHYEF